jgi:hypothetical protein
MLVGLRNLINFDEGLRYSPSYFENNRNPKGDEFTCTTKCAITK